MVRFTALIVLLAAGCTAGRVGQRELDAGGGGMDGDVRPDAANPRDAGDRDAGPGGDDAGTDAGPLTVEADCGDGMDDDGDMLIDCLDPDCDGQLCDAANMIMCREMRCDCGTASAEDEGSCGDGIDDDCDGMFDCEDPECDGIVCGAGPVNCTAGACPCPDGFSESTCDDSMDGDCDGMTDCADPDCLGLRCGMSGFLCSAAMACECPGAGGAEMLCDGEDDNCNGTVDEGCPTGIGSSNAMTNGPFGDGGGTAFVDACPPGAALIGIAGQAPTSLTQLQPICAGVMFVEDTMPFLHEYSVRRGGTIRGAIHGAPGGSTFEDLCPGETFAIGIRGDADNAVDQIRLICAEITISLAGFMSWRLQVTESAQTPARGSTGPTSGPFNARCQPNGVVTSISGMDNASRVTRLAFECQTLSLNLR